MVDKIFNMITVILTSASTIFVLWMLSYYGDPSIVTTVFHI